MSIEAALSELNLIQQSNSGRSCRSAALTVLARQTGYVGHLAVALKLYDHAMYCAPLASDKLEILVHRCATYFVNNAFDDAIQDAKRIMIMYHNYQSSLLDKDGSLRGLKKFRKFLANFLNAADPCTFTIENTQGVNVAEYTMESDLKRMQCRLQEIATGQYDFPAMLREVERMKWQPRLDHATHVGPVEVRMCKDKSVGRGLFVTKDVEAGDLLLCEKAFVAVFVPKIVDTVEAMKKIQDEVAGFCELRLKLDPSLSPAFMNLKGGSEGQGTREDVSKATALNRKRIMSVIDCNCFGDFVSTRNACWTTLFKEGRYNGSSVVGVWVVASYANHDCIGNISRSFIGDMIIIRASTDLEAGSELRLPYFDRREDVARRQTRLTRYGFQCQCSLCKAQIMTSVQTMQERTKLILDFNKRIKSHNIRSLVEYHTLFTEIEATYRHPATKEPRQIMVRYMMALAAYAHNDKQPRLVFMHTERMLKNLGFEWEANPYSFVITKWGLVVDFLMPVFVFLWKALGSSGPAICADVEQLARTIWKILVGEDSSFDNLWGRDPPVFTAFCCDTSVLYHKMYRTQEWFVGEKELELMQQAAKAKTTGGYEDHGSMSDVD